ncbi:WecB/TagA/CpsF family glycosyltransferase [Paracoccus denitrificans]|uniref:WecB/TagA/CpsF family glycosyltransferase n=1 Tax=Paracoccus denitrificans TaxID=266 RepID=UPI0018F81967|nr:WecB/TagA/CpsF family glycosyltransferase [Paracoccus denitrificans]
MAVTQSILPPIARQHFLGVPFDQIAFDDVVRLIGDTRDDPAYRYIVTPNVDHIVRLSQHPELLPYYENAWLTLCDSKPVSMLAKAVPLNLPRVTGADLTNCLFGLVIRDGDRITMIAPNQSVIDQMRARFPRLHIRAHVPPFGVLDNPAELQHCVEFAVEERSDFIFVAIGSPQSEKIAYEISKDPRATGIGLCIGAALEFMTGMKKRAPRWMSRTGLEWLHRLASDPGRLWRRYLFSVLPMMWLAMREIPRGWWAQIRG